VRIALRTQQVLAHESGVPMTADPFAGAYAVEALTLDIWTEAKALIGRIDEMGGALAAIENGFVQNEIGESAYKAQKAIESKDEIVVGVNEFQESESTPLPILKIDEATESEQVTRLEKFRQHRDALESSRTSHGNALDALGRAADGDDNLMAYIVEAVRNHATVGEIVNTLKVRFGEHQDQGF
jgi:methylmalonyl-CoA mutase N-terminal domain/subunit